jgi:hypothetical protein
MNQTELTAERLSEIIVDYFGSFFDNISFVVDENDTNILKLSGRIGRHTIGHKFEVKQWEDYIHIGEEFHRLENLKRLFTRIMLSGNGTSVN